VITQRLNEHQHSYKYQVDTQQSTMTRPLHLSTARNTWSVEDYITLGRRILPHIPDLSPSSRYKATQYDHSMMRLTPHHDEHPTIGNAATNPVPVPKPSSPARHSGDRLSDALAASSRPRKRPLLL
jgi:hypothetical protein